MSRSAWILALAMAVAAPGTAQGQVFLASRPNPEFTIGPLFVRATVIPDTETVTLDVLWSLAIPPNISGAAIEQDLYLLWPNAVDGGSTGGQPDPALADYVKSRGFTPIAEGRLPLLAKSLYRIGEELPPEPVKNGAPFVTFVRQGGPLGLTAPVTYVRIPWTPLLANRTWQMNLRMELTDLMKRRKATWIEDLFWGPQHTIALTFNDVRPRALFPLYFERRDRVVRLADDPSQLLVNLRDADHLKIYEFYPGSARRRLSETLDSTEEITLFLDSSEGISPQVLTVQFGYFRGLRSWAPVLIPIAFFALGNLAMPIFMMLVRRCERRAGRPRPVRARQRRARDRCGAVARDARSHRAGADDRRAGVALLRARGRGARAAHGARPAHVDLSRASRRAAGATAARLAGDGAPMVDRAARGRDHARAGCRHRRAGARAALAARVTREGAGGVAGA